MNAELNPVIVGCIMLVGFVGLATILQAMLDGALSFYAFLFGKEL